MTVLTIQVPDVESLKKPQCIRLTPDPCDKGSNSKDGETTIHVPYKP